MLTRAETIGAIAEIDGSLHVDGDKIILSAGVAPSERLGMAISYHKTFLLRYVVSFGGVWPTIPKRGLEM